MRRVIEMTVQMASEKQVSFLKALGTERVSPTGTWQWADNPEYFLNLTKEGASYAISKMKALPRKQAETLPVEVPKTKPVEGIHVVNTSKGVAIVKVQVAMYGSGRLYTKVWSPSAMKFIRVSGWLSKVSEATLMTKEQATKYGTLYGVCLRCSRPLTDEESIAQGFGPVCAGKMGW